MLPIASSIAKKKGRRFIVRLMESSWRVVDQQTGELAGRARYTVEIQAEFAAEALNRAFEAGVNAGYRMAERAQARRAEKAEAVALVDGTLGEPARGNTTPVVGAADDSENATHSPPRE